jgi:hypothetical protein
MATAENMVPAATEQLAAEEVVDVVTAEELLELETLLKVRSGAELDAWVDRRLEMMHDLDARIAQNKDVCARRVRMIEDHFAAQNETLLRQRAFFEQLLTRVAIAYDYPGKTKTRKLAFGSIGRKDKPAKLVVDDEAAVIAAAGCELADGVDLPIEIVKVERSVKKNELNAFWKASGIDAIPGTHVEPAIVGVPFVKVVDHAC